MLPAVLGSLCVPLLTIETTCDETAAAIISKDRRVLSSVVASQDELHARWGGVVPEVASRAHLERIIPVIDEALVKAGIAISDLVAVGVAVSPGLVGSLLVGVSAAKAIAATLNIPLVGYDHIAAHVYACRVAHGDAMQWPCVALVVSGGHTSLFHAISPLELNRLGGTIDDAAGEAFDKAAALLGLGYPGGPLIEKAAVGGRADAFRFPRPLSSDRTRLDMSFSGLKTALRYVVRPVGVDPVPPPPTGQKRADLAASFQEAIVDSILAKLFLAIQRTGAHTLAVGGGVAANKILRAAIEQFAIQQRIRVLIPPPSLCTDNAAMGALAWERLEQGSVDGLQLDIHPGTDRTKAYRS